MRFVSDDRNKWSVAIVWSIFKLQLWAKNILRMEESEIYVSSLPTLLHKIESL